RIPTPDQRTMAPGLPTLFNKYIGHDDNRDSYMSNMKETANFNRQQFEIWFPEIVYDHHQAGPAGTVIFMPPFRDPFNYNFDPLIPLDIEEVGAAMHANLVAHNMGGSVQRKGAPYSTWWDGGIRTEAYFHNMIGLLTEIIGSPNPTPIPLVPKFQLPSSDWPLPIAPQMWHYRQSIAYAMQNNRAVLDYASRNRTLLLNEIYAMAHRQIEQGSRDSWTITPDRIAALEAAAKQPGGMTSQMTAYGFRRRSINPALYNTVLHDPAHRDPRGYIIPSNQSDFATATKFVNALIKNGTEIERASSSFTVNGQSFPSGSYVVLTAQADRPYVLDMFEPQHYPNDLAYPGGPPVPPYDTAGWTLADQMGVRFTRELDGFSGPFQKLPFGEMRPMPVYAVAGPSLPAGYLISHKVNNAFILINRLMKAGDAVYWMQTPPAPAAGQDLGTGAIYVPRAPGVLALLTTAARELGVPSTGVATAPSGPALQLHPIRIGLYDQYGGSMPSGWVRWLFDQYEFPYHRVWPQELAAGNLRSKFDVLVFVDDGLPGGGRRFFRRPQPSAAEMATVPEKYQIRMGSVTSADVAPLQAFVEAGGTLLTIGRGTSLAQAVGLPITSALVAMGKNGHLQPLSNEKFYIPGSLMRMSLNHHDPIAYGMGSYVDVDFDHDPVFHTVPNATLDPAVAGWFTGDHTLVSGWANGEGYLNGTAAVVSGRIGQGMVYAIGPEVTFRAQPHSSFKLLFNGVYAGTATPSKPALSNP
ncbi:MAG: peptidase, partial [Terriglobales bacterium]